MRAKLYVLGHMLGWRRKLAFKISISKHSADSKELHKLFSYLNPKSHFHSVTYINIMLQQQQHSIRLLTQGNGNNGNYDSNPVNPVASAQHREHARSSPSSQLPSLTSANPNGPASQNSVLQTLQNLVEFNNECLLAYNKYLVPNSEFARVHQRMNQELWQQQQLAREEAAKLKESVVTALAKAIGWAIAHQPGVAPTPVSAKPGLAAAGPVSHLLLSESSRW
jgi:hypothetical protein